MNLSLKIVTHTWQKRKDFFIYDTPCNFVTGLIYRFKATYFSQNTEYKS